MRKFLVSLALLLVASAAYAVSTTPGPVTSTNVSGTIAVTNTFQSVIAANTNTKGCLIQNNGSNTMWVYFGTIGTATKAKSFTLRPPGTGIQGGSISCATGGGSILTDQVSITGTATEAFTAASQQ